MTSPLAVPNGNAKNITLSKYDHSRIYKLDERYDVQD